MLAKLGPNTWLSIRAGGRRLLDEHCVVLENIHTRPQGGSFWFEPPPHWKFQFRLKHSFKNFGL